MKGRRAGKVTLFNNPTQGNSALTQYTINEVEMDYSFYNVREPYNRLKMIINKSFVTNLPLEKEIIIPPGNYAIQDLYDMLRTLINLSVAETSWLCTKIDIQPFTNRCIMQFTCNGVRLPGLFADSYPTFQLGYGTDDIEDTINTSLKAPLPLSEVNPFYSIMLWGFGRQIPGLDRKNLTARDYVSEFNALLNETTLTYISPTIPQASFDCYVYWVSQYMNNFDTTIYEDVTDVASDGIQDLNVTGANISDIWIKVPTSFYNFGDRVWYWPKTPYTFVPKNSNQALDVSVVDQFNRPIDLHQGNYNMHMVFYESRETNFI